MVQVHKLVNSVIDVERQSERVLTAKFALGK